MGQILYEETFYARDSGTLEQLKELSTRRQAIQDSINGISRLTPVIAREMAGGITSPVLQVRAIGAVIFCTFCDLSLLFPPFCCPQCVKCC